MHIHNLKEITFQQLAKEKQMLIAFDRTDGHVAWVGFQPTTNDLELIEPDRNKVPLQGVKTDIMIEMRCQMADWLKGQGLDANGGSSNGDAKTDSYACEGITGHGSLQIYSMPKFSYLVRSDHRIKNTDITVVSHDTITLEYPDHVAGVEKVIAAKGNLEADENCAEESGEMQYEWLHNGCEHGAIGIGYQEGNDLPDHCKGNMLMLGEDCAIDLSDSPAIIVRTGQFVCAIVGTKLMTMCESRDKNYIVQNTIESEFTKHMNLILGEGTVKVHTLDFEMFKGFFTSQANYKYNFIKSADQALISMVRAQINYGE